MSRTPEERAMDVMKTAQFDKAVIFGNLYVTFAKVEIPETKEVIVLPQPYQLEDGKEHDMEKINSECVDSLVKRLCATLREHYRGLDAAQE